MVKVTNERQTVIVLENKKERALMKLLFHFSKTIGEALASKGYDGDKITGDMKATKLYKATRIKKDTMRKLYKARA